ncbi:MAG: hypothetical protein LC649_00125 [Bacteroidales bacterium]|nr:hypothetical protein [Bacteroidales bacterium]
MNRRYCREKVLKTLFLIMVIMQGCTDKSPEQQSPGLFSGDGFFIGNEGNFRSGNGSLSFYSYDSIHVYNNLFSVVNGRPAGDVLNYIAIHGDHLFMVVNNSGKVEVTDAGTLESEASVTGLLSPRNIAFISDTKAYISSLYSDSVTIFNPEGFIIEGYINIGRTSEYITVKGNRAWISNWSMGNTITVIDTENDLVDGVIVVASEPGRIVEDSDGMLWVLCSGGYMNTEYPALYRIDPALMSVDVELRFENILSSPSELMINKTGDRLFFLNGDIFSMGTEDIRLPDDPIIESCDRNFYRLGYDAHRDIIYATDAVDYMQKGHVYGYNQAGDEVISFEAGIIPGSFAFTGNGDNMIE